MAKTKFQRNDRASRIRVIVVDAELQDGEMKELVNALQGALRPAAVSGSRLMPQPPLIEEAASPAPPPVDDLETAEDGGLEREQRATGRVERGTRLRKLRTPKLVDVDVDQEPSFAEFVKDKDVSSQQKKFLAVAAWFQLHRDTHAITSDHAYTMFRHVKWATGQRDFGQPLRSLAHQDFVKKTDKEGEYAITHLGLKHIGA